ncbi:MULTISPECIES: SoxR reducing system RseC family protein [Methylococcus]|jgi:sigma-E factor negative regulatory protein RseC|uniref:Sigma-E factor negative regulatory protein RseC n=1 Tax=Methylococcus capsulatus TaxID=414 RepID=A0AA35Y1M3_METCP|nr:SoxR reducing system RseC family protein [Methylococcus capsulatus]QXP87833.1 SoxR reducing system RseC family protein [Methylococcus capsulatus]QXP90812.1 SoxR reducing system RseC family protein [Methylococcus capsulatus]QXP92427.1 SoxR reducing system RseC family protein [Methylococcus capsulatus]UQN12855.1 SoxR reducing system RseC family protein [Methylococcus capsulatus]CAI8885334.1 sigma-E factor negative regulatory protein RseC [Methylococcus capsulatus]
MIEEEAIVTQVEEHAIWVEKFRKSACGSCAGGCSTSLVARLLGGKPLRLRVATEARVAPGDRVIIGVEEGALLAGSFRMYLFPLFSLIGGALLGKLLAAQGLSATAEAGSIAGGLVGLGLTLVLLKYCPSLQRQNLHPVFIRRISR